MWTYVRAGAPWFSEGLHVKRTLNPKADSMLGVFRVGFMQPGSSTLVVDSYLEFRV